MGEIRFQVWDGTRVAVSGDEYRRMERLCADMAISALGIHTLVMPTDASLRAVLPNDYFRFDRRPRGDAKLVKDAETWLRTAGGSDSFIIDGRFYFVRDTVLNTAIVMGSDPVRLLARVAGQCEIFGYVEPVNRLWMAGIIDQGIHAGVIRCTPGWVDLYALLKDIGAHPGAVVMSYSASDAFPSAALVHDAGVMVAMNDDGDPSEKWESLPAFDRWLRGMEAVRKNPALELKPDNWGSFRFGHGLTGFDVREKARELARVAA